MNAQLTGQPIFIVPEGTDRKKDRDARKSNVTAGKIISEAVKTTLGPKGMDKMLVDNLGDVVITNDGVTILEEIDVQHPAAKMIVEVAKTQDKEVGDGTTTAIVLAGELLKKAEKSLESGVHASTIINGYRIAAKKSIEILNKLAEKLNILDNEALKKIGNTALTGKSSEMSKDILINLCIEAVRAVSEKINNKLVVNSDNIKIEKKQGSSVDESKLISGVLIDKNVVHSAMPKRVPNAKIALLNSAMEIKKTETDAKIKITDPNQMKSFLDQEEGIFKDIVKKLKSVGANVVFCQKGIDDLVQHLLAKENIFAVRRVKKSDMEKLAKSTGASIINKISEISKQDLGNAGLVQERRLGDDKVVYVEDCENPKSVTLLVRGGTEHVVDEIERGVKDSIGVLSSAIEDGKYVAGGGSSEIETSMKLKEFANSLSGKEQLSVIAFADALEAIPQILAENGGMNPIDTLVELKAKHGQKNGKHFGLDVIEGKILDMEKLGVFEPLRIKTQALKSASEAAEMILRVDDVISASKDSGGAAPEGMPPGAGGMPPGMGGM